MRLAVRELRRRPGRFVIATTILSLVAALVMILGGLLDGLIAGSTGALRAQDGDVIVYSGAARSSLLRSTIDAETRAPVEAVPGVAATGGLGVAQLGARRSDDGPRDLVAVALFGYELAPDGIPDPPAPGEAYADRSLRAHGIEIGTEMLLGPARTPIVVVGFVDDTGYAGQPGLWAEPGTWRDVLGANRPAARLDDGTFQALVVQAADGTDPTRLAVTIDAATGDRTATLTLDAAIEAIPGVREQRSTFNQIIGVTVAVAGVVVALFFALVTVERLGLYGVLKALGARDRTLLAGVVVQAVIVTLVACTLAAGLAFGLAQAIPPGSVPLEVNPGRIVSSVALLLGASVAGCAFSLRRVLRVDPATAIGASS